VVRDAKEEREKEGRKETIKLNVPYVKKFIFYVFYGFMAK